MRDRSMALVVRNHKILSVQTHKSGRSVNELPGGGIEPGETSQEAALRELKEECGFLGTISRQLNILHRKDGSTEYVYLDDVPSEQREMIGSDPEIQEGAEQAIKNVRWLSWMNLPNVKELIFGHTVCWMLKTFTMRYHAGVMQSATRFANKFPLIRQ